MGASRRRPHSENIVAKSVGAGFVLPLIQKAEAIAPELVHVEPQYIHPVSEVGSQVKLSSLLRLTAGLELGAVLIQDRPGFRQ